MIKLFFIKSFKVRITHWFFVLTIFPVLIGFFITSTIESRELKEEGFNRLTAIRDMYIHHLESWNMERQGDLTLCASEYEYNFLELNDIRDTTSIHYLTNKKLVQKFLSSFVNSYNYYKKISIINIENGRVDFSSNQNTIGENVSGEDYFQVVKNTGEYYFSDIYKSNQDDKVQLVISTPIRDIENKVVCMLSANIDIENSFFNEIKKWGGLGQTGEILIINKDGLVLNDLKWSEKAILNKKLTSQQATKALQGLSGSLESNNYNGDKVLAAHGVVDDFNWGVIVQQNLSEIKQPVRNLIKIFCFLFLLLLVLTSFISVFIINKISKPLLKISEYANRIIRGDYTSAPFIDDEDEIGDLSRTINKMAISLKTKELVRNNVSFVEGMIVRKSSLIEFSHELLRQLVKISNGGMGAFYVLNEMKNNYEPISAVGADIDKLMVLEKQEDKRLLEILTNRKDEIITLGEESVSGNEIFKFDESIIDILSAPIHAENQIVAFVAIGSKNNLSEDSVQLLSSLRTVINSTYSHLLANERTRFFAEYLSKANTRLELQKEDLNTAKEKLEEHNAELNLQQEKIEEANKELESFTYSVSHDLRAPLRAINGFTDILLEEYVTDLDDEAKRIGAIIRSNSKKMGQLIDDLLAYSRVGRSALNFSMIDMAGMAESMFFELTQGGGRERIEMNIEKLPRAVGDTILIRQVWQNLISNAIKFSSKKEKSIISISFVEKDGQVIYIVKDNGSGFNIDYQNKLFGVFQRLHSDKEFDGTGIGLSIVQQIIFRHNGKVWADGKVDEGAEFFFYLDKKLEIHD